jgi:anthranilate 1,2-dioxygenase large subunit
MNIALHPRPTTPAESRKWPEEGFTRIPYWVYTDQEVFDREMELLFWGKNWSFVGFSSEIPQVGDYKRTWVGTRQVVVARDKDGSARVFENRCAHKGALVCWTDRGRVKDFTCPYHQWNYDLAGNLKGIPFKRGALGKGGMPADFDLKSFGLRQLAVHERNGVIWASFASDVPDFETYCGPEALRYVDRLFPGRRLKPLGYNRQIIECNWKMYFENLKDPYHATLLHAFFITFGLWRADSESSSSVDGEGRHGVMLSHNEGKKVTAATGEMARFQGTLELQDKDTVTPVPEFPDRIVAGITIFPSVVLHQQANTLAMRQIVPKSPDFTEISWHFFGYEDDTPEMTRLRLRHANLMGPSGFVSIDDSEVLTQCQFGVRPARDAAAVIEMGGRDVAAQDHMVTEVMIRGFYKFYKEAMGF